MTEGRRLTEQLSELGIVQVGDPILRATATPFDLPVEAEAASELLDRLREYLRRVAELYPFRKGMGLAAPQIGVSRAAAIVKPPDSDEIITLLNPVIVDVSEQADHRYEGCLSFFDVRGLVERPLSIDIEVSELDSGRRVWVFKEGSPGSSCTRSITSPAGSTWTLWCPTPSLSPWSSTGRPRRAGTIDRHRGESSVLDRSAA